MAKITNKQKVFADEYLVDLNGTRAAEAAGYSQKNAQAIAWQLLQKTHVQAYIQTKMDARSQRTEVTADRVVLEYARLAFASMTDFMEWGRRQIPDDDLPEELWPTVSTILLKSSFDLSEDDAAAVAEVSQTITEAGGTLKLKLHDKKGALDALARHLKLDAATARHALVLDESDVKEIDEDLDQQITAMEERYGHGRNGTVEGNP